MSSHIRSLFSGSSGRAFTLSPEDDEALKSLESYKLSKDTRHVASKLRNGDMSVLGSYTQLNKAIEESEGLTPRDGEQHLVGRGIQVFYSVATGHNPALTDFNIPRSLVTAEPLTKEEKESIDSLMPFMGEITFVQTNIGDQRYKAEQLRSYLNGLKHGILKAYPPKTEELTKDHLLSIGCGVYETSARTEAAFQGSKRVLQIKEELRAATARQAQLTSLARVAEASGYQSGTNATTGAATQSSVGKTSGATATQSGDSKGRSDLQMSFDDFLRRNGEDV